MVLHCGCSYVGDDAVKFSCRPVATDIPETVLDFGAECEANFFRGCIGGDVEGPAALNQDFARVVAESLICCLKHKVSDEGSEFMVVERTLQLSGRPNIARDLKNAPA